MGYRADHDDDDEIKRKLSTTDSKDKVGISCWKIRPFAHLKSQTCCTGETGKPNKFETSTNAIFSTLKSIWTGLETNPGLRDEKRMSNRLGYGTTIVRI